MKGRACFNNISIVFVVPQLGKKYWYAVFWELFFIDNVSFCTLKSEVSMKFYTVIFCSVFTVLEFTTLGFKTQMLENKQAGLLLPKHRGCVLQGFYL